MANRRPHLGLAAAFLLLAVGRVRADVSPITNGQLDPGDDGVVGLIAGGGVYCTGTLVAPRVVLTAAHCLVSTAVTSVLVGPDQSSGHLIPAAYALIHPDFDPSSLRADLGLVLLDEPATATPWALLPAPFDASLVGREVRLVGFGQTSATDTSSPRKREGVGTIASFTDTEFEIHPAPSLTCGGDSGGPAFLVVGETPYLAGVTSAGDCSQLTRSVRVDGQHAFVDDFVLRTEEGAAALGERCFYQEHCRSNRCRFPADAPTVGYCSAGCSSEGDCRSGMICDAGECRYPEPSPGALGQPCASYTDCASLLCARSGPDALGSCSISCDAEAPSCPDGFQCLPEQHAPLEACFRDPGGGCSLVPPASPGPAALYLLALLLLARRWRRLRARRALSAPCAAGETRTCSSD